MRQPKVGVGCLVIQGRSILLGRRLAGRMQGWYAAPGGHIEWRELAEEAACRELVEETGMEPDYTELLGWSEHVVKGEDHHYISALVYCHTLGEWDPQHLEKDKTEPWEWIDVNELSAIAHELLPTIEVHLQRIREIIG